MRDLSTKGYLLHAGAAHAPRFVWDEWNVRPTYEPPSAADVDRLTTLSRRANCAFTIAIAEWVLARFAGMDNDPEPALFLEAAWAANVHRAYADEIIIVDDEWRGPVRGPISMALTFVSDALFAEEAGPQSVWNPAWAARFARHVLPRTDAFEAWFDVSVARLAAFFPAPSDEDDDWFDEQNNWGRAVAPAAFDPEVELREEVLDDMVDEYLSSLDPSQNEFLRNSAEMRAAGFRGTPYEYP